MHFQGFHAQKIAGEGGGGMPSDPPRCSDPFGPSERGRGPFI